VCLGRERHLCDKGGGGGRLVLPGGGKDLAGLVVTSKTVDAGLDEDETELAVLVLAVLLEVLADGDGLLDEEVEVLRDGGGEAVELQDAEDLGTGDGLDLADTVRVTEDNTDLRGGHALACKLADNGAHLLGRHLLPGGGKAAVGQAAARNALTRVVHATHVGCLKKKKKTKKEKKKK